MHKVIPLQQFSNYQDNTRLYFDDIDFKKLITDYWGEYLQSSQKILDYIDIISDQVKLKYNKDLNERTNTDEYRGLVNDLERMIRFMKLIVCNYFCYSESNTQIFNLYVIGRIFYEDYVIMLSNEDNIRLIVDDKIEIKLEKQSFWEIKSQQTEIIKCFGKHGKLAYCYYGQGFNNATISGRGVLYSISENKIIFDGIGNPSLDKTLKGRKYNNNNWVVYNGEFKGILAHGEGTIFYKNGNTYYVGNFTNNWKEGIGEEYYKNGEIKYYGEYQNNLYHGLGSIFEKNKIWKYHGMFQNGKLNGYVCELDNQGKIKVQGWLMNDVNLDNKIEEDQPKIHFVEIENGWSWVGYDKENQIRFDYKVIEGKIDGKRIDFWRNGEIKSESLWTRGRQVGKSVEYHQNGQIASESFWKDNKWEGEKIIFYEDGQIKSTSLFKRGRQVGKSIEYYENGQIKSESLWKKGLKDGKSIWFSINMTIESKSFWKEGKQQGIQIDYYENEKIKSESFWKEGQRNGKDLEYHQNGHIKSELFWKEGQRNGKDIEYNENGHIRSESFWKEGKRHGKRVVYFLDGRIERESFWKEGEQIEKCIVF